MFATISFSILIGLLAIVAIVIKPYLCESIFKVIDSLIIGIAIAFILNLLMILQRLYLLFESETP